MLQTLIVRGVLFAILIFTVGVVVLTFLSGWPGMDKVYSVPPKTLLDSDTVRSLAEAKSRLTVGTLTLHQPTNMRVAESQDLEAIISRRITLSIPSKFKGKQAAPKIQLKVGPLMAAMLKANDDEFKITPLQSESPQAFSPSETIHWIWRIKPLKPGKDEEIYLTINALFHVKESGNDRLINIVSKKVILRVSPESPIDQTLGFVREHAELCWTIFIAVAGVVLGIVTWGRNFLQARNPSEKLNSLDIQDSHKNEDLSTTARTHELRSRQDNVDTSESSTTQK